MSLPILRGSTHTHMDWGQHLNIPVSLIFHSKQLRLGFHRRNSAFTPKSTKEVAYKTLVRPKLDGM